MFSYTQRAAPSKKKRKRGAGDDQGTLFDIVKAGKGALRVWYCTSFKIVKLEFVLIEQCSEIPGNWTLQSCHVTRIGYW